MSLAADSRFSYSFFEIPTIIDSILPDVRRFLPTETARRLVLRDMDEHIREAVDKHCGRLRYDLAQRLEQSRLEHTDGRGAVDAGTRAARERLDGLARRLSGLAEGTG